MEKDLHVFKKWAWVIGMMCLPVAMLSSCSKTNNNVTPNNPTAEMAVVDASPDSPSLDFYLNNSEVNSSPVVYGGGITYFQAPTGLLNALFNVGGTQTKSASDTLTLTANHVYTLFLANSIAKPDFILMKDTIVAPATGMAAIRFINLGSDAPAVDLAIRGKGVIVANKSYKSFSGFVAVAPAINDTLEVRQAGTTTVLATLPAVYLQRATVYTVWLQGLINTSISTQKPSINAYENASYQ